MEAYFASFPVWMNFIFFVTGLLIVTIGADWFTDGAVGVAEITGVPKVIVGATLVSWRRRRPNSAFPSSRPGWIIPPRR